MTEIGRLIGDQARTAAASPTAVGTVIQPGESIPDDVTEVDDRARDGWKLDGEDWTLVRYKGDPVDDRPRGLDPDYLIQRWGPLTVTAVREQPRPGCPSCGTILNAKAAACTDAWHWGNQPAPEPPQADAPALLDLVQQYGYESYQQGVAAGHSDEGTEDHYDAKARALFARIAELVQQRPVQARDYYGVPLWIHTCGDVRRDKGKPERRCDCFSPSGPWRPLLVGGDPAPERLQVDLGEALDEAVGDYEAARAKLLEVVTERDEARAEVEHGRKEIAYLHEIIEGFKAQVHAEIEQADDYAAWATKLAHAAIERLDVPITEEAHAELWEAALDALTAPRERIAQAHDFDGVPLWIHLCGEVDAFRNVPLDEPPFGGGCDRCDSRYPRPGDWRPLLAEASHRPPGPVKQPAEPGPVVLTLPQVPEGAVALTGTNPETGEPGLRFTPGPHRGEWLDYRGVAWQYHKVLVQHEPLTVEFAPPREPRTWPKLDEAPGDSEKLRGASGMVYARSHFSEAVPVYRALIGEQQQGRGYSFYVLQHLDGPLTEVLDAEPGGAR